MGPHLLGAGAHWLSWEARECQSWGHASLYSQTASPRKYGTRPLPNLLSPSDMQAPLSKGPYLLALSEHLLCPGPALPCSTCSLSLLTPPQDPRNGNYEPIPEMKKLRLREVQAVGPKS